MSIAEAAEHKARAFKKIEELANKRKRLEENLQTEREFSRAAWDAHGNEICAADLERRESDLKNAIQAVDEDIALLMDWKELSFAPSMIIENLQARIREYSCEIAELNKKKTEAEDALKKQERLEELLK
jgi:hypothetical protein